MYTIYIQLSVLYNKLKYIYIEVDNMELSEDMIKMIEVVKNYDSELKKSYTSYIAPDIPDKVIKKLLKKH